MGCEYGECGQRQMKARTNWKQDEKGGGGVSMPTKMRENLSMHRLEMSRQRGL